MNGKLLKQCPCTRRTALKFGAVAAAGLALGGSITGCGELATLEEDIAVDLPMYPDLAYDGGVVRIRLLDSSFPFGIYVRRESATEYRAFSGECTHASCEVEWRGERFECPCHGSMFSPEGRVLTGPASEPLVEFDTVLEGLVLTIKAQ